MDFTREPIIETIITPRDGSKLTIRNSKTKEGESYTVDAVEVVSFGASFFYRSMERPKSFLVPVSDYEVVESKETRVVLKNAPIDKSIKIAGGRAKKEQKPKEEKKGRSRRSTSKKAEGAKQETKTEAAAPKPERKEGITPPPVFRSLLPPPPTLISEKLSSEKAKQAAAPKESDAPEKSE